LMAVLKVGLMAEKKVRSMVVMMVVMMAEMLVE